MAANQSNGSASAARKNATRFAIIECCHDRKKPGLSRLMPLTSATVFQMAAE